MSGGKWNVLGIASARRGGLTFAACGAGGYFPKGRRCPIWPGIAVRSREAGSGLVVFGCETRMGQ